MSDKKAIVERERDTWAAVADGWRRRDEVLKRGGAKVAERMIALAEIGSGMNVLDVASGTGEPAISIAQAVAPDGQVVGTDLVEEMLEFAREKAAAAKVSNIEFRCVEAELIEFPDAYFDAATMRWGLMFMPEPEACLQAIHRTLKPGAKISLACWAVAERNPAFTIPTNVMRKYKEIPIPPPGTPGMYGMGEPDYFESVIAAGGFKNIHIEDCEVIMFPSETGQQYWETISDLAGPIRRMYDSLPSDQQQAFVDDVSEVLDSYRTDGMIKVPGVTLIASAEC